MFISSNRLSAAAPFASILLVLLIGTFVGANDVLEVALHKRAALQSAEVDLLGAKLELEQWKHAQLEELHRDGFASWLELRRHQLTVKTINVRLESARDFQTFLAETKTEKRSAGDLPGTVFRERETKPIKVFLPGSIRLIGWIEGQTLTEPGESKANEAAIEAAREKLAEAQRRFNVSISSNSLPAAWHEKASLDLAVAKRELERAEALENLMALSKHVTEPSVSIDEIENLVTADDCDELKLATLKVAKAESAAHGEIKRARIMLQREQRRVDAMRSLQSQGHASKKELDVVNDRLAKIKSQLDALTKRREALGITSVETDDLNQPAATADYDKVNDWPAIVFNDEEFALHLIDLRRQYYNQQSARESARLKSEFLQEVLARLVSAASPSQSNSQLGSALQQGQQNEIESYESDIAFANASLISAHEQQQILVHEENRFVKQTIAQFGAAHDNILSPESRLPNALGMLSLLHPTAAFAPSEDSTRLSHFSYLESGGLDGLCRSNGLWFSQSNLDFVGSPYCRDSTFRLSTQPMILQPLQSSWLISDATRKYSSSRGLRVEPDWMNYFRRDLLRNAYSARRCYSPYYDFDLNRSYYQKYGYRTFGMYDVYPNGILRPDLRVRVTPGQVPWYLPGSPTNVRANQLYNRGR